MNQSEVKPRTVYQKFKLTTELFEHYAQLLVDQCWLEVVVFEIPRINLERQDQEDLTSIISRIVPVEVRFDRVSQDSIQVSVKRLGGCV